MILIPESMARSAILGVRPKLRVTNSARLLNSGEKIRTAAEKSINDHRLSLWLVCMADHLTDLIIWRTVRSGRSKD